MEFRRVLFRSALWIRAARNRLFAPKHPGIGHFPGRDHEIGRASGGEEGRSRWAPDHLKKKRRKRRWKCEWSSDVCSSDLPYGYGRRGIDFLLPSILALVIFQGATMRSEERRVGKRGDLGGRRII